MSDSPVKYLSDAGLTIVATRTTTPPFNRSATGYGRKLPTSKLVQLENSRRWYRVYAIQYGNAGSAYILRKGEMFFLKDGDLS